MGIKWAVSREKASIGPNDIDFVVVDWASNNDKSKTAAGELAAVFKDVGLGGN